MQYQSTERESPQTLSSNHCLSASKVHAFKKVLFLSCPQISHRALKKTGKALTHAVMWCKSCGAWGIQAILKQGVSLDQTSGPHKEEVMAPLSSYETAEETEKTTRAVNHSSLALVHAACWMRGEAEGRCVWATQAADERGAGEHWYFSESQNLDSQNGWKVRMKTLTYAALKQQ